ncbi:unnamed protein product [Paramecium sonneborni]|uniref:Uncharacterized protein n=1 Tax=Paramecium sonneborni TaxID=65129 RepID=A0A8S1MB15_9CILI|nr:unnamed protein product [Paramecium sonneborni]
MLFIIGLNNFFHIIYDTRVILIICFHVRYKFVLQQILSLNDYAIINKNYLLKNQKQFIKNRNLMFVPPPYYYKQFNSPKSFSAPDLEKVKKHVDDYYSFGKFYQFKDIEADQIQILKEKLAEKNIQGNLKQKLKEISQEIFEICIKIQESIANVDNQHLELRNKLDEKYQNFNLICQFIHMKKKYSDLEEIYKNELVQLDQINKEMEVQIEDLSKQVDELNSDFIIH